MACLKCGKSTEREVYICKRCVEEANSQFHLGRSTAVCPSILNYPDLSGATLLSVEEDINLDALRLFGDPAEEKHYIDALSTLVEDATESNGNDLLRRFSRILANCGLNQDIEAKPPPLLSQGDLALAESVLKGAAKLESKFPSLSDMKLYILIGSLYYNLSMANSGVISIAERAYHLEKAAEYFDKALSIDQGSISAWKNKAKVLLEKGDNSEAIECLDWILENLEVPGDDLGVLLNKGIALLNSQKYEEASNCFNEILDKDPSNVEAWRRKGDIFAETDRWGGAIQCYNEAVKHDPSREDIWIAISKIYVSHEKYKEASNCLDEVLRTNIWNYEAWYLQGIVFSKIGRWGAAVQCLNKALSINPSHIEAWKAKGDLLAGSNRYDDALDCYERALKIQPENFALIVSIARTLKSMKRYNDALQIFGKALKVKEDIPEAWYEMGDILQETGKVYKALKSFDHALKIDPSFIDAYYKKGLTLEKLRRFKEALQCYDKALELDPNFEKASRAKNDCLLRMKDK